MGALNLDPDNLHATVCPKHTQYLHLQQSPCYPLPTRYLWQSLTVDSGGPWLTANKLKQRLNGRNRTTAHNKNCKHLNNHTYSKEYKKENIQYEWLYSATFDLSVTNMVFIFACDSGLKSIFMPLLLSLDSLNKELLQIESPMCLEEIVQSFPQTLSAQIEKNNRKIVFFVD